MFQFLRAFTTITGGGTDITATDVGASKRGLDMAIVKTTGTQVADSGTTTISSVGTSEVEVTSPAGQQAITVTNLAAGKIFYSFDTGVGSTFNSIDQNDQLVLKNFASSIFLIKTSGSNSIQIDRFIKT